jgi:transcriptional regulator with XRE-family HTH domain
MTAPELFGSTLRQQRERRGLALAAIADSTKISRHLLASLERGDVSRWPGGIYRRAFVRAYASAVGLPPEPTLSEFVRLFPEPGQDPPALLDDDDPRRLRLTLVTEPRWKAPALRSTAAFLDAGAVVLVAVIASRLTGIGFWLPAALAGLTYHATAAALLGRSPGAWLMASGGATRRPRTIRDQFARLRHGWFPGLLNPGERSREHPAAT